MFYIKSKFHVCQTRRVKLQEDRREIKDDIKLKQILDSLQPSKPSPPAASDGILGTNSSWEIGCILVLHCLNTSLFDIEGVSNLHVAVETFLLLLNHMSNL